jgi:hypothetical protein
MKRIKRKSFINKNTLQNDIDLIFETADHFKG